MYHRHTHSSSSAGSGGSRDLFQLKGKVHPGPSLELGEGTSGPVWKAVLADPLGGLFPAEGPHRSGWAAWTQAWVGEGCGAGDCRALAGGYRGSQSSGPQGGLHSLRPIRVQRGGALRIPSP